MALWERAEVSDQTQYRPHFLPPINWRQGEKRSKNVNAGECAEIGEAMILFLHDRDWMHFELIKCVCLRVLDTCLCLFISSQRILCYCLLDADKQLPIGKIWPSSKFNNPDI